MRTFTSELQKHVHNGLRKFVAGANLGQRLCKEGSGGAGRRSADHFQRVRLTLNAAKNFLNLRLRFLILILMTRRRRLATAHAAADAIIRFLHAPINRKKIQ